MQWLVRAERCKAAASVSVTTKPHCAPCYIFTTDSHLAPPKLATSTADPYCLPLPLAGSPFPPPASLREYLPWIKAMGRVPS